MCVCVCIENLVAKISSEWYRTNFRSFTNQGRKAIHLSHQTYLFRNVSNTFSKLHQSDSSIQPPLSQTLYVPKRTEHIFEASLQNREFNLLRTKLYTSRNVSNTFSKLHQPESRSSNSSGTKPSYSKYNSFPSNFSKHDYYLEKHSEQM